MLGVIAILLLLLAALAAGAVFLPRLLRGELGALQQTTATELGAMQERTSRELSARNAEFELRLQGLEQTLNTRLAATTQTTTQIHDRLGQMTQATGEMIARAKELGKLEQALRPPKACPSICVCYTPPSPTRLAGAARAFPSGAPRSNLKPPSAPNQSRCPFGCATAYRPGIG